MVGLQHISNGAVSYLKAPLALPAGNAETIVNSLKPFHRASDAAGVRVAAQTGFIDTTGWNCGGGVVGGPGIGTGLIGAGLGAVPVVGGILQKAFSIFGAHHANAVRNEQATACQAVPAANNFLRQIDAALAAGELDVTTAPQALEQGYQQWLPMIQGIIQEHGNTCNAGCIYRKSFRAAIEKRKQDYAIIAAQTASASQNILHGVSNAARGVSEALGFGGVVHTVATALGFGGAATASADGSSPSASGSALVQAGLTPARQTSLAMTLMAGGVLVLGVFWFEYIRRAEK